MIPTAHNIKAVANARAKRIGEKGGTVDDVIARAEHYANRSHNPAATAQAAEVVGDPRPRQLRRRARCVMPRRMSCNMTIDAVRDRSKTVTRRHVDTWKTLKPGDRLTLIEKGMGLKPGEKQVVICEVEVVDVRVEPIVAIFDEADATDAEGLPDMMADEFVAFWLEGHGYRSAVHPGDVDCRRIEWRYLDEEPTS